MKRDVLGPWPLGDTGVVCGENIRTTLLKRQGSSFSSCTRCSRQQQGYYGQYSGFSSAPISSRSSQKETLKLPPFFLWQKQLNILLWIATLNFCPDHLTRSVYNSTSIVMVLSLVLCRSFDNRRSILIFILVNQLRHSRTHTVILIRISIIRTSLRTWCR
jgi:hypothetical protein